MYENLKLVNLKILDQVFFASSQKNLKNIQVQILNLIHLFFFLDSVKYNESTRISLFQSEIYKINKKIITLVENIYLDLDGKLHSSVGVNF
jgi:hypothetical protein